ncbi:Protein unc-80 -like protein [Halotydeus destructor]|nr:Protein unc-80 -like protein [Halotydeus destructor]
MSPKGTDNEDDPDSIPLPIQTFLWRQTSPFIRPRFGRQQDATAMEQREACKSFEKVLVQNIQFGLSPSLAEAINSVSRWQLIQAAFPHVMHCTSALLYNRRHNNWDKLGAGETKLLYTLHWVILDAAEECADAEYEQGIFRPMSHYMFPISAIEVFIYLFAPLTNYLKQSDFLTSFRLENGYKIWDPIFQKRHPDIPCFVAECKPKRDVFSNFRAERKLHAKFGDVFLGASLEKDGNGDPSKAPDKKELKINSAASEARRGSKPGAEFNLSQQTTEKPKAVIKQLKHPMSATFLDVAVIRCLFIDQWLEEGIDWALTYVINRLNDITAASSKPDKQRPRSASLPNMKCSRSVKNRTSKYVDHDGTSLLGAAGGGSVSDLRRSSFGTVSLQGDLASDVKETKKAKKESKRHKSVKEKSGSRLTEWKKLRSALMFTSHEFIAPPPRPESSLGLSRPEEPLIKKVDAISGTQPSMSRGKSMPSLHIMLERRSSSTDTPTKNETNPEESEDSSAAKNLTVGHPSFPNPIITITEHSPVASVQFFVNDAESPGDTSPRTTRKAKSSLCRSQSDKNINYYTDTAQEAPGSSHYITKNGHLSLMVILKAMHSVATRENAKSLRVCEGIVEIVKRLIALDLLKQYSLADAYFNETNSKGQKPRSRHREVEELSVHQLFIDTLMSVNRHLGCPHGCTEGFHGSQADCLRKQILDIFLKLFNTNESQFIKYFIDSTNKTNLQELIDLYHAFLGFCASNPTLLSPMTQKRQFSSASPTGSANEPKTGYATNFGAGFGKLGAKGIEGVIINHIFKPLVSRCVKMQKELKLQENLSLYCELRQLINYVKDNHGGIFRKVALSSMLDSHIKFQREVAAARAAQEAQQIQQVSIISANSATGRSPFGEEGDKILSHRKSFFRKKGSNAGLKKAPSTQSINDDFDQWPLSANAPLGLAMSHGSTPALLKISRAASPRLSITDDEALAMQKKQSKFGLLNLFKGENKRRSENVQDINLTDGQSDSYPGTERLSRRASFQNRGGGGKLGQKSSSHVSLTFMKGAKKRMEDQFSRFGFGKNKNKQGSFDDNVEMSRRNSFEFENTFRDSDMLVTREARLVSLPLIKNGMLRFSFLLEACTPGTLPDPPLMAAVLELKAPLAARAAFYLEVAHFIHSCNRGHWPSWMKLNVPLFRPSMTGKGMSTNARGGVLSHTIHRSAGRMFYMWAEAIGARLEDMLQDEACSRASIACNLDDARKRQLRTEDDEEDFLDESSVNPNGNDCPFALKLAATQVLYEITAFLRESHQYLPSRSCRTSISKPVERGGNAGYEPRTVTANRRWSMALSSLGFSQASAHSLVSLNDPAHPPPNPGERRISFVLHEADGEVNSHHSSTTTLTCPDEHKETIDDKKNAKRPSQSSGGTAGSRAHLLRRSTGAAAPTSGNGSFKRRSLKLKKGRTRQRSNTIDDTDDPPSISTSLDPNNAIRRVESMRSRRRVSGISEKSDVSERADVSGEESPGILSDDGQGIDSPTDALPSSDQDIVRHMPWVKVIVSLVNSLDFECSHHHYCAPNCYKRQTRASSRLVKAITKMYEFTGPTMAAGGESCLAKFADDKDDALRKEKKLKKIITGPNSPMRRKTSVGHNVDKHIDQSAHGYSVHSSATLVPHMDVEAASTSEARKTVTDSLKTKRSPVREDLAGLKYVKTHVKGLFHNPISLLIKSALILQPPVFVELLVISWELLKEEDQHMAATAAAGFIISSVKSPDYATELLNKELNNEDPVLRIKAINKFHLIWKSRYHCWPRMEDGAHLSFKVPPPSIEFTLPSPKIALDTQPVADPPWMPMSKAKVEEVTITQDQSVQKSFVTATKTRRKQQIELVHKALQKEKEKLRDEREIFRISAVPITNQAAYEPALFHTMTEEHAEEGDDDQAAEKSTAHHMQVAQAMFPSSLCAAAITIINLLDDPQVGGKGSAVYEVAYKVIWHCLVEDTALFLRHFFEKLTREKQKVIFQTLRRLIRFMPRLPAQAAYTLYNYLIGFIMYHVRSPVEGSQQLIGDTLSVLWLVVPSVHGLFLKDLKQILKKEQCDATMLITANVPSAKKIIVHGPDVSGIPSQFPIHEDTQFSQILIDSLDFFGIDDALISEYFLVDTKTNQMHNLNAFVRDFYFFKRSQYPQLSLVRMNPTEAFEKLQTQAFQLQFLELGKALMSLSIVKSPVLAIQRVLFLHEELMKLPSFPRKALEANFGLYRGAVGREMLGMDTLHKIVWVRLVARMFDVTNGFFAQSVDIHLFINVVNGALILHCEDAAVLRLCMATYLNAAHQFKNIFAHNGYMLIIPTILRIYSNHQTNGLLTRTIEFVCKQFYIMHRKPFMLQMFGAVAPILDTDAISNIGDATKIQPKAFFQLIQSLGQYIVDPLDILELVDVEKPLKALDFCYQMDPETVSMLDSISLCVTVVAYAADSTRARQMLMILDSIVPLYMKHMQMLTMKKETPGGPRTELQTIHNISVCIKTLVSNCEALTRNFTGPQRAIDLRGSSMKNVTKGINSPPFEIDEDSHSNQFSRFVGDSYYASRSKQYSDDDDSESIRDDFRRPRDILLNLVAEFLTRSTARLADLSKKVPDLHQKGGQYELLDIKSHLRLAEVAHSLLKVAPYDPQTMGCRGLLRYMSEVLPTSEWRQEAMRPALIMILRRLDKMFNKIAKKSAIKRLTDWDAAKRLLKGVYLTFVKHPYIVHLPHLKSLISVCQNIILGDANCLVGGSDIGGASGLPSWAAVLAGSPPSGFSSVAVRLVAMQMLQMGDTQTLEVICGSGGGLTGNPEKAEIYLLNMIYPMCIRISGGLKDVPKLRPCDITFTLSVILNSLKPPPATKATGKGSDSNALSPNVTILQSSLHQIGFLGLKIMMVCFDRQLASEWYKICQRIRELTAKNIGGVNLWNFLDFVVTHRTPLFILLMPMIRHKLLVRTCDNEQEYYYQQLIRDKLQGRKMPSCRSKGQMLVTLLSELKHLKEDLVNKKLGSSEKGKVAAPSEAPSAGHRLSFAISSTFSGAATAKTVTLNPIMSPKGSLSPSEPLSPFDQLEKPQLKRGFSFDLKPNVTQVPTRGLSFKLPSSLRKGQGVTGLGEEETGAQRGGGGDDSGRKLVARRTSYPYNLESATSGAAEGSGGGGEGKECDRQHASQSEPKLYRKSTALFFKKRGSRRGFGNKDKTSAASAAAGAGAGEASSSSVAPLRSPTSVSSEPDEVPIAEEGADEDAETLVRLLTPISDNDN